MHAEYPTEYPTYYHTAHAAHPAHSVEPLPPHTRLPYSPPPPVRQALRRTAPHHAKDQIASTRFP